MIVGLYYDGLMCLYVTLAHLRSKEITGTHKPCIPHSNNSRDTSLYSIATWERGGH